MLGVMLALLSVAGPISQFLQNVDRPEPARPVGRHVAARDRRVHRVHRRHRLLGGGHPAQTQLQEPAGGRAEGRVYGVLFMLVSVSSFVPIVVVGPISGLIGTATVMLIVADRRAGVWCRQRPPARPEPGVAGATADPHVEDPIAAALGADRPTWRAERGSPGSPLPPRATDPVGSQVPPTPPIATDTCLRSRSSSPAGRSAWASTRWPAGMSRRSMARRSSCGHRAGRGRRRRADRPGPEACQPLHVRRRAALGAGVIRTRSTRRRSPASSSSRAPTRSRRPRSRGTSSARPKPSSVTGAMRASHEEGTTGRQPASAVAAAASALRASASSLASRDPRGGR